MLSSTAGAVLDNDDVPTPFGVHFYAADAPGPRPLPAMRSAPEAAEWERRIQEGEYAAGPYGAGLAETLQDAGNYFHSRGDYRSAIAFWRRAVHLTRVNDGLYSEMQLPILHRLLETYRETGDFESADEIQSYLWYLARQHHAPGDMALIEATVEWVDWRRRQWLRNPDPSRPEHLLSLWQLLDSSSEEDETTRLTAQQLAPLVYAQIDLLFAIGVSDFGLDRQAEMMLGRGYGNVHDEPDIDKTRIQALQDSAWSRGRTRLETLAERMAEAGDEVGQARALKTLGDWHIWYNNSGRAREAYESSWRLVTGAGDLVSRARWFSEPLALPAGGALWAEPGTVEEFQESVVVSARFTVTDRGRVRDLDTEAQEPEHRGEAIRLHRLLRGSRFRPRMVDGAVVDTPDFEQQYRVF